MNRSYSNLIRRSTFEERFNYLRLLGSAGKDTFGFDRYLNQDFYRSREWRQTREFVIVRDEGCDLGVPGYEIHSDLVVHHMNPMTPEDIIHSNPNILNPEFLITTTKQTHSAIHYGDARHTPKSFTPRKPGDTDLWRTMYKRFVTPV